MTTEIPRDELDVLSPYRGGPVLEFGNKKNSSGTYRDWYTAHGCKTYVCIDWNGEDGALDIDCTEPFKLSPSNWSVVTNFGFSEHVTDQPAFWENIHNNTPITGIMCGVTPAPGHWPHHGILQPSLQFYKRLAHLNGYDVTKLYVNNARKRHTTCYRFVKMQRSEFVMPPDWEDLILPTEAPNDQALGHSRLTKAPTR
jgi:hypothetical protein